MGRKLAIKEMLSGHTPEEDTPLGQALAYIDQAIDYTKRNNIYDAPGNTLLRCIDVVRDVVYRQREALDRAYEAFQALEDPAIDPKDVRPKVLLFKAAAVKAFITAKLPRRLDLPKDSPPIQ